MTDITSDTVAATYASNVSTNLDETVQAVTSALNLSSNVTAGLSAQYAIQQQRLSGDNGQLEIILTMLGQGDNTIGIQVAQQHPWSRGTVFIATTSAFDSPSINPSYFNVVYDEEIMNFGSGFARKLAATAPLSDYLITETLPGAGVTGTALTTYTKQNSGTEYHPLGTCAMLPRDKGGVVDTSLLVYGSSNLRVIDASIMPLHISAHLMASSYGVAEKGADIIKKKYMAVVEEGPSTSSMAVASSTVGEGGSETGIVGAGARVGSANGNVLSTGAKAGIGAGVAVIAVAGIIGLVSLLYQSCVWRTC
jgi:choline dehydrogenase